MANTPVLRIRNKILFLFFLAISISHLPLQAYTISGINGNTLTNPTVGFHGFSITFPQSYSVWVPPDDERGQSPSCPLFAWIEAKGADRVSPGWGTDETWVYNQESSAIAFSVLNVHALPVALNRMSKDDTQHMVFHNAGVPKWLYDGAKQYLSKVEDIGGVAVGKAGYKTDDYTFVVYFVAGTLKECFLLVGVSEPAQSDQLILDMDKAVGSMKRK